MQLFGPELRRKSEIFVFIPQQGETEKLVVLDDPEENRIAALVAQFTHQRTAGFPEHPPFVCKKTEIKAMRSQPVTPFGILRHHPAMIESTEQIADALRGNTQFFRDIRRPHRFRFRRQQIQHIDCPFQHLDQRFVFIFRHDFSSA